MQLFFGKPAVVRNVNIQDDAAPAPSSSRPGPVLKAGQFLSSLFFPDAGSGPSPASTASQPQYRDADARASSLPSALQDAVSLKDMKRCLQAAVNIGDSKTMSQILEFACSNASVMPFEVLRDAIDKLDARQVEILIHHPAFAVILNEPGAESSVLGYAIRNGDASILSLLLSRKSRTTKVPSLCAQTRPGGNTLLHLAAASGDRKKLELILDFDPGVRRAGDSNSFLVKLFEGDAINAKNHDGKTALALAIDASHTVLADLLLERGAHA
jgi:ankyrin repeat protein